MYCKRSSQKSISALFAQGGFSLLELMVTLAVIAILTSIAIPNLRAFILNQRRDTLIDGLVSAMHYARNQALNLDQKTTLCAGTVNATCTGGAWANGWEVVTVPASAASVILTTHVLQTASTTPVLMAVNGTTAFQFNGLGLIPALTALPRGYETLQVCDSRGAAYARAVEINSSGYIQSSQTPGITPAGVAIICP